MRNTNYTQALNSVRKISARATFTDQLMRFSDLSASESITINHEDSDLYGTSLLRVAVEDVSNKIFWSIHAAADAGFTNTTFTNSGFVVKAGSRIGLHGNVLFFQDANGVIQKSTNNGSVWSAPVSTGITYTNFVSIAPVSATEFYVVEVKYSGTDPYAMRRLYYHTTTPSTVEYYGRLYGDVHFLNIVDAVRLNGVDYIYFLDNTEKRTVYIKKSADWWSEVMQVVPMDVVDDMTSFVLTSANVLNGTTIVTGSMTRTYGDPMTVYVVGPEEFTFGRELIIRPNAVSGGKLHLFDNKTYFVGPSARYMADQTMFFGVDNPALKAVKTEILGFSMSGSGNSSYGLNLNMFHDFGHVALRPGSQVKLEMKVNDEYSNLGLFNIDGFSKPLETSGVGLDITLRSDGYKRLSQWVSDTSYDYWSQTKLDTDPSELSAVLRVNGDWNDGSQGLYLDDFNSDGYMYLVSKACHNGLMRARFYRHDANKSIRFGVGLNYHAESKYEASVRLGIEMDDVQESQYGKNGIFAIYGDTIHYGAEGVALYQLENNTLSFIVSNPCTVTPGEYYWLMIRFDEGDIKVDLRKDTDVSWTSVITRKYSSFTSMPWKANSEGRGAIMSANLTANSTSYAFSHDSKYIPVDDNSVFPSSGEVIVDNERILYGSKSSTGYGKIGPFNFRYGLDWHKNLTVGSTTRHFGRYKSSNRYVQTIQPSPSQYINAISLWVSKIGDPKEGLKVSIYKAPRTTGNPLGTLVASSVIPATDITEDDPSWVTAKFKGEVLWSSDTQYLVLERDDSSTVYTDTITANYEYKNYYRVHIAGTDAYPYDSERYDEITKTFTGAGLTTYKTVGFVLWARLFPFDDGNVVHCIHKSPLPTKADMEVYSDFNGMALVVTEGKGAGNTFGVRGYQYYDPGGGGTKTCVFHLNRDAQNLLDDTSVYYLVPTLRTLTRGANDTVAVAHAAGICHYYKARPFVSFDRVQYYSSEQDMSLEDVVRKITRKAGVRELNGVNLYPDQITPSTNMLVLEKKNFRVECNFSTPFIGNLIISGRRVTTSGTGVDLHASETSLSLYIGATEKERVSLDQPLSGKVIVTYHDNHIGVWCNGKFIYTFAIPTGAPDGNFFTVTGTYASPVNIYVPEASIRIDNYILDAGQNGEALIGGVIGEKRFYLADDIDGKMKLFRDRTTVNSNSTPYQLTVSGGEVQSDASLATRMRLEGSDIREKYDPDLLVEHGNLFYMANMSEINTPADAEWFADVLLDDVGSRVISKAYFGAADPRIEPNDIVYVETKEGIERIIVDNVSFVYTVGESGVAFDMSLNGRVPREDIV